MAQITRLNTVDEIERLRRRLVVLKAMRGDPSAFEDLYREFHPRLLFYARRLVHRDEQAEDVMQDVWIIIYKEISKLREPDAFRFWCYKITRTTALQTFKGLPTQTVSIDDVGEESLRLSSADEIEGIANAELIYKALDDLSPPHREVLILKYLEGLAYEEIAELTRTSIGTVRSRLFYAKKLMEKSVKELMA